MGLPTGAAGAVGDDPIDVVQLAISGVATDLADTLDHARESGHDVRVPGVPST